MRKLAFLAVVGMLVGGCASSESPPTATDVPPTHTPLPPTATDVPPTHTPLPPTATSIPLTSTPNPDVEKILLEFSEAINEQSTEAALALFAEDAIFEPKYGDCPCDRKDRIELWINLEIQFYETSYKFSEFEVEGNEATWTWFMDATYGKQQCVGMATIQGDQISYMAFEHCHYA